MRAGKYFGALLVAAQHPFVFHLCEIRGRASERGSEGALLAASKGRHNGRVRRVEGGGSEGRKEGSTRREGEMSIPRTAGEGGREGRGGRTGGRRQLHSGLDGMRHLCCPPS